jgi:hypothetical protein
MMMIRIVRAIWLSVLIGSAVPNKLRSFMRNQMESLRWRKKLNIFSKWKKKSMN